MGLILSAQKLVTTSTFRWYVGPSEGLVESSKKYRKQKSRGCAAYFTRLEGFRGDCEGGVWCY